MAPSVGSFAEFDRQARDGQPLSVVFFGGSLTWGANASDPQRTSYRALMCDYLRKTYPRSSFAFYDAAIGGTGSKLGLFRLDRDVLARQPDLVFLDFTANDGLWGKDEATLACYETIVRDLTGRGIPVVQAFFAFREQFGAGYHPEQLARYQDHLRLAKAYGTAVGDSLPYIQKRLNDGTIQMKEIWPFDGAHPDDTGYRLFFEAVRDGFDQAVREGRVCKPPATSVINDLYGSRQRIRLVDLPAIEGWHREKAFRTSAFFDGLSSRWIDDVLACSAKAGQPQPIKVEFTGTMVGLLAEADTDGLAAQITIDGKPLLYRPNPNAAAQEAWPMDSKRFGAKLLIWRELTDQLAPGKHTIEIRPVMPEGATGQLRIESVCAAGAR